jgi:cobyrinic acid a,c-diamide synthase
MGGSTLARVVIAGLAGDAGKTLVAAGLARALKRRGVRVAPFKKGPDYIDAAWLGAAAGVPGRNLDTFLMATETILGSVARSALSADLALVEGNRGLFDGLDAEGSHSTAVLARLLRAPVLLLVDASKVTRTAAALVLGCRALDPELELAGVVLNRVGTSRQEKVIRQAVGDASGVPVIGAIPRVDRVDLPSRHLGLVTVSEHPRSEAMLDQAAELIAGHVDLDAVLQASRGAPALPAAVAVEAPQAPSVTVGVARDAAFSFYYPENLEALEAAGARLEYFSPLTDGGLPEVDALVLGGGFPEVHVAALAANVSLKRELAERISAGLPVWAECGGLMYLARTLAVDGTAHEMVGSLPIVVEQTARPQGHGYVSATIDDPNPFFERGRSLRGHEFHYSKVIDGIGAVRTVMALDRGVGVGGRRDGVRVGGVVASYTHLHAAGAADWAPGVVRAARGEGW